MEKLQPGYLVHDRFRVLEEMDGGGQSFIFKGEDDKAKSVRERFVCIKQFEDVVAGSAAAKALRRHYEHFNERLGINFSKIIGKEKQRYICLPIDLTEEYGSVIAVFPWLKGVTLDERLKTLISPPERARITIALAGAVRGMHEQNIVHVDLSPHQVMVHTFINEDGKPVAWIQLIDLDAAIVDGETIRGKILGKVGYASPEHFLKEAKKAVSTASDVFTLGLMLLQVLLGAHPYGAYAANRVAYRTAISRGYFRVPDGDYDRDVIGMLVTCLSPDPKLRPSAKRVHQSLLELREARPVHPERRWAGQTGLARSYVQLTRPDASPPFRRVYYEGVKLTLQELRGSGLSGRWPAPCELRAEGPAWVLKRLHKEVPVSVDERKLRVGGAAYLKESQTVTIAAQPFVVSVVKFNVALKSPEELIAAKPTPAPVPEKPATSPAPKKPAPVAPEVKKPVPVVPATLVVKEPVAPVAPAAAITAVNIEYDVTSAGERGIKIIAGFFLSGLKGTRTWVGVWIESAVGISLKDADGAYRDGDGNVATIDELVLERDPQVYTGYVQFIPYRQLHLPIGRHDLRLYVRILRQISAEKASEIARSEFFPFWCHMS
jgi:Protein kinase domain